MLHPVQRKRTQAAAEVAASLRNILKNDMAFVLSKSQCVLPKHMKQLFLLYHAANRCARKKRGICRKNVEMEKKKGGQLSVRRENPFSENTQSCRCSELS
jgi:hypothetical protein